MGRIPFTLDGITYDIAKFDGSIWNGVGSSNINVPKRLSTTADGNGLLTGGNFNSFNGVPTGQLVRFSCDVVVLLGDVNLDGVVNLLDVAPFVELLTNGSFQAEADTNQDGVVNLLDVQPFVDILSG